MTGRKQGRRLRRAVVSDRGRMYHVIAGKPAALEPDAQTQVNPEGPCPDCDQAVLEPAKTRTTWTCPDCGSRFVEACP